jgi:hypothetical protein
MFSESCLTNTFQIELQKTITWTRFYYISSFSVDKNTNQKDPFLDIYSSLLQASIPAVWKLAEYTSSDQTGRPTRLFSTIKQSPKRGNQSDGKRRTSTRLNEKKRMSQGIISLDGEVYDEVPDAKRLYCRELWAFDFGATSFKKCDYPGLLRLQGIRLMV